MAIEQAKFRLNQLFDTLGREALHALYPVEFEVYLIALELATSEGDTIDYFVFPITPNSIQKTEPSRTNIKKTASGTTVLSSTAYVPQEIQIKGNFGRFFKILSTLESAGPSGVAFSTSNGVYDLYQTQKKNLTLKTPIFDIGVKTGYGAIRLLKSIINKSNGVDAKGFPFRLYFYNLALGESYLVSVPPSGLTLNQTEDSNMIWNYSLNLQTLAPLSALKNRAGASSLTRLLATSVIQRGINDISRDIVNNVL